MKRVVFEGTEEQMNNLKALLDYGSNDLPELKDLSNHKNSKHNSLAIQSALKKVKFENEFGSNALPELKEDYYTGNLWGINDVKNMFECEDKELMMKVLEVALEGEWICGEIQVCIQTAGEVLGLTEKEEEEEF